MEPAEKRLRPERSEGRRHCRCSLPEGAAVAVPCSCLRAWAVLPDVLRPCVPAPFLRCVRRSAVGEAWPPRLRFRPSPRALPAFRTQRRPRARNRPAMTKDGPGRKKALAGREAVRLCRCPAGSVPPWRCRAHASGPLFGPASGRGPCSPTCSGPVFRLRFSPGRETFGHRGGMAAASAFRPSPRALPAVRTQRRPRARNRPAMRQRTAPAERRRWQAVRPCACAVALPEACRRGVVSCSCLWAAVWACVRAWAVLPGDCRVLWP